MHDFACFVRVIGLRRICVFIIMRICQGRFVIL